MSNPKIIFIYLFASPQKAGYEVVENSNPKKNLSIKILLGAY